MVNKFLIMQAIQISTPALAQAIHTGIVKNILKEIMDATGNGIIITDDNEDIIGQAEILENGGLIAVAKPGEASQVEQVITEIFSGITYSISESDFSHEDYNIGEISIEYHQYMIGAINKVLITITYDGMNTAGVHLFPR